ncbi:coiled-coil domain-containing protein 97-like [Ptychodera flava]|uniref:coiled-coil domain-containing protein 97-like n=1 Tax=Ptychodera flava TaxID=63121 RepID=UPI00396A1320
MHWGDFTDEPAERASTAELSPEESMIKRIANSNARIKNQQRGEPDLTEEEKINILRDLLHRKPAVFLERFGSFLESQDMQVFDNLKSDYEIDFYLKEIQKQLDRKKNLTKVRNRRYEAMKKLMDDGTYFSEDAMQERDPLMYEQYVGQYLTAEEKEQRHKKIDQADLRFSTILMDFMDRKAVEELLQRQKKAEDDAMEEEEEEDSESEDDEDDMVTDKTQVKSRDLDSDDDAEDEEEQGATASTYQPVPATDEEKSMLRHEFMRNMQLRFIQGQDRDFDYGSVDTNVEYDSLDIREHDEEESYFDDEEPSTARVEFSSDEGSQDVKCVPYTQSADNEPEYDEMELDEKDSNDETDR